MRRAIAIALVALSSAGCLGAAATGSGAGPSAGVGSNGSHTTGGMPSASSPSASLDMSQPPGAAPVIQAAPAPASTAAQELVKFGECMQLADWTSSGMGDVQNQTTAGSAGECYSCHGTGMYNVALTKQGNENFDLLHTMPWLLKFAQATTAADGTFQDITPTERIRDRGSEAGHPTYTLTNARQQALDQFFQLTYTHYKAGNCSAPTAAPFDGGA